MQPRLYSCLLYHSTLDFGCIFFLVLYAELALNWTHSDFATPPSMKWEEVLKVNNFYGKFFSSPTALCSKQFSWIINILTDIWNAVIYSSGVLSIIIPGIYQFFDCILIPHISSTPKNVFENTCNTLENVFWRKTQVQPEENVGKNSTGVKRKF